MKQLDIDVSPFAGIMSPNLNGLSDLYIQQSLIYSTTDSELWYSLGYELISSLNFGPVTDRQTQSDA